MTISRTLRRPAVLLLIALPFLASSRPQQSMRDIVFVGTDYAFAAPATVAPGLTAITFDNRGKQRHEMNLVRLKPGITLDSVLKVGRGPSRRPLLDLSTGGILLAESGQHSTDRLLVNFEVGRSYMLICNLKDAPDRPEHSAIGMVAGLKVE
jgi:hypothetical protein